MMEPAKCTSDLDRAMTMNVLYVTGRLSDADFIEHELGKIAPHIRIDVSPTCDDVLARVAVPGRYDAVLLDPVLPGGESLRQIARIREHRLPLAIVVMTGPYDEDPPLQVLQAGADDYIVRRPHFVDSIPWILQRVVERRRLATEGCAHESSAPAGSALTQEPASRREAAVTGDKVLEEEQTALQTRLAELEELRLAENVAWNKERRELEQQKRDLENKHAVLEKALAASEAYRTQLLEEQTREREDRGKAENELEQQRAARVALEDALHAVEARQAALLEEQRSERAEWQTVRDELDRQRTARLALGDALRALEARLAQLEETRQAERTELEALRQELERQRAARLALEGALRAAEAREQKEPFTELATAAVQAFTELLVPVSDCSSLLMECLGKDDPRRVCAMRLVEITRHAGKLARQLLTLRNRQEALDLNLIVAQMAGKLRSLAGESVKMVTILSPRLPRILAARPLTEQLLTALVAFARDLLPAGGTITLETAQRAPEAALGPEQCVLLAVTASGFDMQPRAETAALDLFVAACGASLSTAGDAETGVTIDVSLPAECQVAAP
jgi:DNA-binding response OmpR family regulator